MAETDIEQQASERSLFNAAVQADKDICAHLIEKGTDVNGGTSKSGPTPLYIASQEGHLDIVQLLVKAGADLNRSPEGPKAKEWQKEKQTPLLIACMRDNKDVIRYLLEAGADVNAADARGLTPFLSMCSNNDEALAEHLIKQGAKYNVEALDDYNGQTNALLIAAGSGSLGIVRMLVEEYGFDVNYTIVGGLGPTTGETALWRACENGFQNVVEYLIEHGANVNATSKEGISCLQRASSNGHVNVVRTLAGASGVNINQIYTFVHLDPPQDATAYDLGSRNGDHGEEVAKILHSFGGVSAESLSK